MDVDQVGEDERQMGPELFYAGQVQLSCPRCRNTIEVSYESSEYPVGVPSYNETHAEGAKIIRGFSDLNIAFGEEIYSFEEESRLYLKEDKRIITNICSGVSELLVSVSKNPSFLYEIEPRKFEELIAHIFFSHGFIVDLTKKTRDGGRDIIAFRSDALGITSKYIIECKRYASNNPVNVELVRSLYGVQMQEGANKSILATTSRFTLDAQKFASAKNTTEWSMDLRDFDDINRWIGATIAVIKS